jgi:hypothetical protein
MKDERGGANGALSLWLNLLFLPPSSLRPSSLASDAAQTKARSKTP